MAIVTTDILLEGIRRDAVFKWLSDPSNHTSIVDGAFSSCKVNAPGDYVLTVKGAGKTRELGYQFDRPDDSHGGRRVLVKTTGKRFEGSLNYSLRTMKPSTNTLVTLHMDYDPGSGLGLLLDRAGINEQLEAGCKRILETLSRAIPRG